MNRPSLVSAAACAALLTAPLAAAVYDEAIDGDLPDYNDAGQPFEPFALDFGSNTITGHRRRHG